MPTHRCPVTVFQRSVLFARMIPAIPSTKATAPIPPITAGGKPPPSFPAHPLVFIHFLDHTSMCFGISIIINSCQKQISLILFLEAN